MDSIVSFKPWIKPSSTLWETLFASLQMSGCSLAGFNGLLLPALQSKWCSPHGKCTSERRTEKWEKTPLLRVHLKFRARSSTSPIPPKTLRPRVPPSAPGIHTGLSRFIWLISAQGIKTWPLSLKSRIHQPLPFLSSPHPSFLLQSQDWRIKNSSYSDRG